MGILSKILSTVSLDFYLSVRFYQGNLTGSLGNTYLEDNRHLRDTDKHSTRFTQSIKPLTFCWPLKQDGKSKVNTSPSPA